MSSIIASALKLTFGLLCGKARDGAAKQLKGGDLTDETFRKLIVSQLSDIKTKLDEVARKDLCSSFSFLEEGICLLNLCSDKSTDDDESKKEDTSETSMTMFVATKQLTDIVSDERFKSAKRSFEKSNTKATEAFSNEALSAEDRILATKLRVTSKILESLEDPNAAAEICKLYLKKLHDLPAIREMLSVYFRGGMKSLLNKTKREENVMLIAMINLEVFDFTIKYCNKVNLLNWPMLDFGTGTYHPLFLDTETLRRMGLTGPGIRMALMYESLMEESPSASIVSKQEIHYHVNTKGEIIAVDYNRILRQLDVSKIDNEGKEHQLFINHEDPDSHLESSTIDSEDNVYIVIRTAADEYQLLILDAIGEMKHRSTLEFPYTHEQADRAIVLSKDKKKIFIHAGKQVYVYDSSGRQLKYNNFPLEKEFKKVFLAISDANEVIVAPSHQKFIYIYTEEGKFQRSFEVSRSVQWMTFNYLTNEVIIIEHGSHLSSYSKTGEQRQSFKIPEYDFIISHPSGQVALGNYRPFQREFLFLQKFS